MPLTFARKILKMLGHKRARNRPITTSKMPKKRRIITVARMFRFILVSLDYSVIKNNKLFFSSALHLNKHAIVTTTALDADINKTICTRREKSTRLFY